MAGLQKHPHPHVSSDYRYIDRKTIFGTTPANTRRWCNVGLLLGQRHRRWTNSKPDAGPTSHVCWDVTCVSS